MATEAGSATGSPTTSKVQLLRKVRDWLRRKEFGLLIVTFALLALALFAFQLWLSFTQCRWMPLSLFNAITYGHDFGLWSKVPDRTANPGVLNFLNLPALSFAVAVFLNYGLGTTIGALDRALFEDDRRRLRNAHTERHPPKFLAWDELIEPFWEMCAPVRRMTEHAAQSFVWRSIGRRARYQVLCGFVYRDQTRWIRKQVATVVVRCLGLSWDGQEARLCIEIYHGRRTPVVHWECGSEDVESALKDATGALKELVQIFLPLHENGLYSKNFPREWSGKTIWRQLAEFAREERATANYFIGAFAATMCVSFLAILAGADNELETAAHILLCFGSFVAMVFGLLPVYAGDVPSESKLRRRVIGSVLALMMGAFMIAAGLFLFAQHVYLGSKFCSA